MIILIYIIFIIIGIVVTVKDEWEEVSPVYWFCAVTVTILTIIIFILCYPFKITEKLTMYEEENTKIEEKVKSTVQGYMNYESETYSNLVKDAELETLLIKYPELNSNELVKSQIELYKENNKKIKELKEQQITKSVWDWWLKFNIGS